MEIDAYSLQVPEYETADDWRHQEQLDPFLRSKFYERGLSLQQKLQVSRAIVQSKKTTMILFLCSWFASFVIPSLVFKDFLLTITGDTMSYLSVVYFFGGGILISKIVDSRRDHKIKDMIKDFRLINLEAKVQGVDGKNTRSDSSLHAHPLSKDIKAKVRYEVSQIQRLGKLP